jgi:hypothetical protein
MLNKVFWNVSKWVLHLLISFVAGVGCTVLASFYRYDILGEYVYNYVWLLSFMSFWWVWLFRCFVEQCVWLRVIDLLQNLKEDCNDY